MSADLISIKTRQLFREYFVGTTLRFISDEFDAARVDCDSAYQPPVSGARRSLVEQYYHSVNWTDWRDVKKVLQVFESILHTAEKVIQSTGADSELSKRLKAEVENMLYYLHKDDIPEASPGTTRSLKAFVSRSTTSLLILWTETVCLAENL